MANRRTFLRATTALVAASATSGCASLLGNRTRSGESPSQTVTTRDGTTLDNGGATGDAPTLAVAAGPDLTPVLAELAHAWNANPPPSDTGAWPPSSLDANAHLADHFAARHGFEPTNERHRPPILVTVAQSPAPANARAVADGRLDLGGTGLATVSEVLPDRQSHDEFVGHVPFRGGQVFVVSEAIREAGVEVLSATELRDLYAGRVTSWRAVGGPDRDVYLVTGPESEQPSQFRRTFLDGVSTAGIDERDAADRRRATIARRADALGNVAPSGIGDATPALDVTVDGSRCRPSDAGYPTTFDVHLYSNGDPDSRERAFLDALTSAYLRRRVARRFDVLPRADGP